MHDIEPHYKWKDEYDSVKDKESPFYGRVYSEFTFTQKVYNYFIHPQWDEFGSQTLYTKILFVNYEKRYAILEFIGEWNDCLYNDVMFLKREIIDSLVDSGINKFVLICENVMNFHGSDDAYYEEWYDDIKEDGGWITFLNLHDHVQDEMENVRLQYYANFGGVYQDFNWRKHKPKNIIQLLEAMINGETKQLGY